MKDEQKILFAKRLKYLRKYPSAFIEEVVGIKLLPYQKLMVDKMSKYDFSTRIPNTNKKYYTYISLLCHFIEMKDDDYIATASPDKVEKLNKEEIIEETAKKLVDRLAKTKAVKDMVNSTINSLLEQ